jgi:flavorubredoxin
MLKVLEPNKISYIEGDNSIPCPNLFIINGSSDVVFIDVTNDPNRLAEALDTLNDEEFRYRNLYVVLTHFHQDHVAAIKGLPLDATVLCSKYTAGHLPDDLEAGIEIVSFVKKIDIGNGEETSIIPVPSLHSKGSLDVLVGDRLFTGDSLGFRMQNDALYYNHEVALEMEKAYASIPFKEAIQSHPDTKTFTKEKLMGFLHELVAKGITKEMAEDY